MRAKPYPFEAARQLRARALDAASLALSAARTRHAAAEAERTRLETAIAELGERRRGLNRPAADSGVELARAGAYAQRLAREQDSQREVLQRAAAEALSCARDVRVAELKLTRAYAEREVIERHYARFAAAARRKAERAEEAELDDLLPHLSRP